MEKVILYSKSTCPKCKGLKKQIQKIENIQYEIIEDIELMKERGIMEVPILSVFDDDGKEKVRLPYGNAANWIKERIGGRSAE